MREIGQQIDYAKKKVERLIGIPVVVKIIGVRGKATLCQGKICSMFPSIFTVQMDDGTIRTFSYSDVHTKNVLFLKRDD